MRPDINLPLDQIRPEQRQQFAARDKMYAQGAGPVEQAQQQVPYVFTAGDGLNMQYQLVEVKNSEMCVSMYFPVLYKASLYMLDDAQRSKQTNQVYQKLYYSYSSLLADQNYLASQSGLDPYYVYLKNRFMMYNGHVTNCDKMSIEWYALRTNIYPIVFADGPPFGMILNLDLRILGADARLAAHFGVPNVTRDIASSLLQVMRNQLIPIDIQGRFLLKQSPAVIEQLPMLHRACLSFFCLQCTIPEKAAANVDAYVKTKLDECGVGEILAGFKPCIFSPQNADLPAYVWDENEYVPFATVISKYRSGQICCEAATEAEEPYGAQFDYSDAARRKQMVQDSDPPGIPQQQGYFRDQAQIGPPPGLFAGQEAPGLAPAYQHPSYEWRAREQPGGLGTAPMQPFQSPQAFGEAAPQQYARSVSNSARPFGLIFPQKNARENALPQRTPLKMLSWNLQNQWTCVPDKLMPRQFPFAYWKRYKHRQIWAVIRRALPDVCCFSEAGPLVELYRSGAVPELNATYDLVCQGIADHTFSAPGELFYTAVLVKKTAFRIIAQSSFSFAEMTQNAALNASFIGYAQQFPQRFQDASSARTLAQPNTADVVVLQGASGQRVLVAAAYLETNVKNTLVRRLQMLHLLRVCDQMAAQCQCVGRVLAGDFNFRPTDEEYLLPLLFRYRSVFAVTTTTLHMPWRQQLVYTSSNSQNMQNGQNAARGQLKPRQPPFNQSEDADRQWQPLQAQQQSVSGEPPTMFYAATNECRDYIFSDLPVLSRCTPYQARLNSLPDAECVSDHVPLICTLFIERGDL